MAIIAPFGSWESPITTDLISSGSVTFNEMQADDNGLYWTETHPKEKGRSAMIRYDGKQTPLLPEINVRSRVHEYGGGAFCLSGGKVIFSNDADKQLYELGGAVQKLTDAPNCRFADGSGSVWVCEEHGEKVKNFLVRIDENGIHEIASGHDFYSSPRLSPDGKKLAFVAWDFPYMQWDSSTLWLADVDKDGQLYNLTPISGGPNESVCQVQWSPEGILHFVSDKTGFWNLYRFQNGTAKNLCEMDAEFGVPPWVFGRPTYSFLPDGKIACIYTIKGVDHLGLIDPQTALLTDLKQPFTALHNIVTYRGKIYFFGASPTQPSAVVCYDPQTNHSHIIKTSTSAPITEEWIAKAETIEYTTHDGKKGYAFYYAPKNPNYRASEGERPPLIVKVHGGPTSRSYNQLNLETQFWTSRGFALVDVNYGGSTGYGREYFKRLEKNWGIVDVEDSVSAALVLVELGLADPQRLVIRGGSAGGYTTLAALAFKDIFAAGTSYFGLSDLEMMNDDTHKFEARYNDMLIGPCPEFLETVRARSPIHSLENMHVPVLLLQGADDKIVVPNQSYKIYDALKEKGVPVGIIVFDGEGHGFRQAPNIKRALDSEYYFYCKILGIQPPEEFATPPVEISGL
ncbi:MAG: S9 family peptidase [Verrucomicrobia bacterium]|nr:S9 family peptidase [Verrucomicrobiota bacterium]